MNARFTDTVQRVALVQPETFDPKKTLPDLIARALLGALIGGLCLMFLLPLVTRTLGLDLVAPGYWTSVLLAFLLRQTRTALRVKTRPFAVTK